VLQVRGRKRLLLLGGKTQCGVVCRRGQRTHIFLSAPSLMLISGSRMLSVTRHLIQ